MGVSPWVHDNAAFMIFTLLARVGGVEELFTNAGSLYPITDLNAKVQLSELVQKIRFVKAACRLDRRGGYLCQANVEAAFCLCMQNLQGLEEHCKLHLVRPDLDLESIISIQAYLYRRLLFEFRKKFAEWRSVEHLGVEKILTQECLTEIYKMCIQPEKKKCSARLHPFVHCRYGNDVDDSADKVDYEAVREAGNDTTEVYTYFDCERGQVVEYLSDFSQKATSSFTVDEKSGNVFAVFDNRCWRSGVLNNMADGKVVKDAEMPNLTASIMKRPAGNIMMPLGHMEAIRGEGRICLLYTSPSPRD